MPISRALAILTILMGAALAVWSGVRAFGSPPPPLPLTIALTLSGLVAIALGVGIARRSRIAWSFMMPLTGVGALALLMALPGIIRGGTSSALVAIAVALVGGLLTLLIIGRGDLG